MLARNLSLNHRTLVWRCLMTSGCTLSSNCNRDLDILLRMPSHKLAYRVMKLQRLVNAYQQMCDPIQYCGKDKVRVDHPDPEDIIVEKVSTRKIALKVLYRGWNYLGYAWEDRSWNQRIRGCTNVVERVLLEALLRQQIIPYVGSEKSMRMERCGRTDRLVSGISQVVSLQVRSNLNKGYGVWGVTGDSGADIYDADLGVTQTCSTTSYHEDDFSINDTSLDEGEIPYLDLLNNALPDDIRVLAWSPVSRRFSPRYDCNRRTYRYAFPRGLLNIELMHEASQKFVGKHDFRNFCKKSDDNLFKHFEREIFSFKVEDLRKSFDFPECDLCVATISARSFLNKQIRMMMSVLALIGLGNVPKEKIDELLDVDKSPRKPGYSACKAFNLVLLDCCFDDSDVSWRWCEDAIAESARMAAALYGEYAVKGEVLRHMYATMCATSSNKDLQKITSRHMTESLVSSSGDAPMELSDEFSKSVKEKQETSTRRKVHTLLNRGSYRKAAMLYNSGTLDPDLAESSDSV